MWDLPSFIICDDVAKDLSDCLSPLTSAKSYFSESRCSARYFPANIPWPMTVNDKERIESLVVYDGEGKALVGKWVLLALFVISSEIFTPKSSDFVGSHTTQKHGTLEGPIGHNFHMSG